MWKRRYGPRASHDTAGHDARRTAVAWRRLWRTVCAREVPTVALIVSSPRRVSRAYRSSYSAVHCTFSLYAAGVVTKPCQGRGINRIPLYNIMYNLTRRWRRRRRRMYIILVYIYIICRYHDRGRVYSRLVYYYTYAFSRIVSRIDYYYYCVVVIIIFVSSSLR